MESPAVLPLAEALVQRGRTVDWDRVGIIEALLCDHPFRHRTYFAQIHRSSMGEEITLTVSLPFLAFDIPHARLYQETKEAAQQAIQEFSQSLDPHPISVIVNTADELEGNYYLTLTGTSAENGDDGAVGRGNRVNGLIAPFRSTSLEAACGKNPISHVGKIYNVLALLTAQRLVGEIEGVAEATVYILSQIGKPLDQPLVANARIRPVDKLTPALQAKVAECMDEMLARVDEVGVRIRHREIPLF